jgi:8-oxo-dGTP pyrophosphatase MutT (NUDIX family)
MRVRLSLAESLPPAHVSSSILSIVLNWRQQVLYLWPSHRSGSISHLLIGGRPEDGETPEQTAIREVGEETGWRVEPVRMIGFRHFFQLEPWSEKSDRPYPDFIQPIYVARAVEFDKRIVIPGDRIPAEFIDFAAAESAIDIAQRPLLYAARARVRVDQWRIRRSAGSVTGLDRASHSNPS